MINEFKIRDNFKKLSDLKLIKRLKIKVKKTTIGLYIKTVIMKCILINYLCKIFCISNY